MEITLALTTFVWNGAVFGWKPDLISRYFGEEEELLTLSVLASSARLKPLLTFGYILVGQLQFRRRCHLGETRIQGAADKLWRTALRRVVHFPQLVF